jgi:hypothetical protein
LGKVQEILRGPFGHFIELAAFLQTLPGVVPHCFEEPVSGLAGHALRKYERLVDESTQQIENLEAVDFVSRNYRFGRLEPELTRKYRESPEHLPFGVFEQLIGPIDGVAQRLLARRRRAPPTSEELEALIEVGRSWDGSGIDVVQYLGCPVRTPGVLGSLSLPSMFSRVRERPR